MNVREHVLAAGDLDQVVQESRSAGRVNGPECAPLLADHEQHARARPSRRARPDPLEPGLDLPGGLLGLRLDTKPLPEVSHHERDVLHAAVAERVRLDPGALQLALQLELGPIDDRQVRPEREDAFQVRVEQPADARDPVHFGWILVEAAHAHEPISGADGKEHLGDVGDEGDDPPWRGRGQRPEARGQRPGTRYEVRGTKCQQEHGKDEGAPGARSGRAARRRIHRFAINSHKKNGPPIRAVTTPTGSSIGARTVRASVSQSTRNAAPNSADAISTAR